MADRKQDIQLSSPRGHYVNECYDTAGTLVMFKQTWKPALETQYARDWGWPMSGEPRIHLRPLLSSPASRHKFPNFCSLTVCD